MHIVYINVFITHQYLIPMFDDVFLGLILLTSIIVPQLFLSCVPKVNHIHQSITLCRKVDAICSISTNWQCPWWLNEVNNISFRAFELVNASHLPFIIWYLSRKDIVPLALFIQRHTLLKHIYTYFIHLCTPKTL